VTLRYSRQTLLPWLGEKGQRSLSEACVGIVGVGAMGSASAQFVARAGIGKLILVDRDFVEESNLPRQILFDESDAAQRLPKVIAARAHLERIRSDLLVEALDADLDADLARSLFERCDLVLDGTDNFETRYLLNDTAVEYGKPWIYAGAVSTYGAVMVVRPGLTPCLRCLFPDLPAPGSAPTCETVGVLGSAVGAMASLQVTEAVKILAGRPDLCAGAILHVDLMSWAFSRVQVPINPSCPCCGERRFEFLAEAAGTKTHRVCGRDGVMVLAPKGTRIDLQALRDRVASLSPVFLNPYLLQTEWEGHPVTVYADGRVMVQKTDDPTKARALYARYLGM
jgi:molybdopterin/thiamine biosynthesis adenylyltransferase